MMDFLIILGALLVANAIWTAVGVALLKSKKFQTWYANYCMKMSEDLMELFDEDED